MSMAPQRIEIVVVPASCDRARSGAITGPIWLRHAARGEELSDFPEANWIDFPVVILGWWLEALLALEAGTPEFSFMDGPFWFTVSDLGDTLVRVRCFGTDARVPAADFQVPLRMLEASLRNAAASALAECDRRGWAGRDVMQLRAYLRLAE